MISPLEKFLCDSEDPEKVFKTLAEKNDPPSVCGKLFENGDPTYSCRDCGQDHTCVMCSECFQNSEHQHHKYKVKLTEFLKRMIYSVFLAKFAILAGKRKLVDEEQEATRVS